MFSSVAVCENCGSEVAGGAGAELQVTFRDDSGWKVAVLCDGCAMALPGVVRRAGEPAGGRGDSRSGHSIKDEIEASLARLPERHHNALLWFAQKAGEDVGWPGPLSDGTLLVCRPKGIYKPRWSRYALSVRESLKRTYPDEEPVMLPDGTWSYCYFQENLNVARRDREYANEALLACVRDRVPVGVMRQVVTKPKPRYRVLGIALVRGWREGYFQLEGASVS